MKLLSLLTAVCLLGLSITAAVLLAQGQATRRIQVLAVSPSYFECRFCESFHRHRQFLERNYPGVTITELKVDQPTAQAMGITAFPTLIVGERIVGYGPQERQYLQELLSQP